MVYGAMIGAYAQVLDKALAIGHNAEQARRRAENSDRLLGIGLASHVGICGNGRAQAVRRSSD